MAYRLPTGLVEMSGGCVSVLVSWYALLGSAWVGSVGVRVASLPEGDAGMLSVRCGNACFGFVEGLVAPSHVYLKGAVFSQML